MKSGKFAVGIMIILFCSFAANVSYGQDAYQTILPMKTVKAMINEVSGTVPYNTMVEIAAFNRNRTAAEYESDYHETKVITRQAADFGFDDIRVERFGSFRGGETIDQWDAENAELWILTPEERLIAAYRDDPAILASGSKTAEVTTDLVYAGAGSRIEDYAGLDVAGKIVLVSGSRSSWGSAMRSAYRIAVDSLGAVGVISFKSAYPYDRPGQIPWARLGNAKEGTFGFNLPFRTGNDLRDRLEAGEKITVKAVVKTTTNKTDNEVPTAVIRGDGSSKEEVFIVAHLFEGITKQGANDNISGSVAILEAGRMLNSLIRKGIIARPKRTIRFLWVPEIIGTLQYFQKYPEEVNNMIAGINLDMVGEDIKKNRNLTHLILAPYSLMSYINDVAAHFFNFASKISYDPLPPETRRPFPLPIDDPNGSKDPFLYDIVSMPVGGSDHMIPQMPAYKIPTIFFNNWPDLHYHSNQDRPDKSDPTQLKRIAFLTGIIAYSVANAGPDNIPAFLNECVLYGGKRIAADLGSSLHEINRSDTGKLNSVYKEQLSKIHWAHRREQQNINSLLPVAKDDKVKKELIQTTGTAVLKGEAYDKTIIDNMYSSLCRLRSIKPVKPDLTKDEIKASKMIPHSPISGRSLFGGRGRGIPSRYSNELLNYMDGKLTILELRNAVSAEYGPIDIKAVMKFFTDREAQKTLKITYQ